MGEEFGGLLLEELGEPRETVHEPFTLSPLVAELARLNAHAQDLADREWHVRFRDDPRRSSLTLGESLQRKWRQEGLNSSFLWLAVAMLAGWVLGRAGRRSARRASTTEEETRDAS